MEVKAKKKDGKPVTVEYDFGKNLKEASALFGEDVIFQHFLSSSRVALQGFLRGLIDQDKKVADIAKAVAEWKPSQKRTVKSPQEKIREQIASLTPEARAALLEQVAG